MSIRTGLKVILILCIAYLTVSNALVTRLLWFPMVHQYEENLVDRRAEETELYFSEVFDRVRSLTQDYAQWELSCEYMRTPTMHGNEPEIETYEPGALGVDFMAYVDDSGTVVMTKSTPDISLDEPALALLYMAVTDGIPPGASNGSGALFHQKVPVFVSVEAIRNGRGGDRCTGYVVAGNLLDTVAADLFGTTVSVADEGPRVHWSFSSPGSGKPSAPAEEYIASSRIVAFEPPDGTEAGVHLEFTVEHKLLRLLEQASGISLILTLATWLVMAFLVYGFVSRFALRRIAQTAREARALAQDDNPDRALPQHASREFSDLVDSFNTLLSHRRTVLEALTIRESQRAELFENALDGIVTVDRSGCIQDANRAALAMLGYTRDELLDRSMEDLIANPTDVRRFRKGMERLSRGDTVNLLGRLIEFEVLRKSGDVFPAETSVVCTSDGTGDFCFTAFIRDIAERRRFVERVIDSQKFEVLGQLTGQMAHDFNNILGVTLANIQLVEMEARLDPDSAARLSDAQRACWKGASLIQKLLAVARRQETHRENFPVQATVEEMIPLLRSSVGEGIQFEFVPIQQDVQVFADRSGFESCLLNLVANARDAFDRPGKITVRVAAIPSEGQSEFVEITVTDNGRGMSAQVMNRALEPFFTTKPMGKGTGLGLAMVHAFTQESGGKVSISSQPGMGTTVTLRLPVVGSAKHSVAPPAPHRLQSGAGQRVLVVDDQDGIRASVAEMLRRLGYSVTTAESAEEGLRHLETAAKDQADLPVDLILTDVIMPGQSGLELKGIVGGRWPSIPVVFMTGFSDGQLDGEGILEGERILKPFGLKQLATFINGHIERIWFDNAEAR